MTPRRVLEKARERQIDVSDNPCFKRWGSKESFLNHLCTELSRRYWTSCDGGEVVMAVTRV